MGTALVIYIFVSGILGLPRSLISIPVFGFGYLITSGAGGSSGAMSELILWVTLLAVAGINTYGMSVNFGSKLPPSEKSNEKNS